MYCGGSPETYEHIFGDWLKNYMPKINIRHNLGKISGSKRRGIWLPEKQAVVGRKNAVPHSWTVKCVCSKCNSGWMGDIQEAAKPVVAPMIEGQPLLLDRAAQTAISAWAASAAITAEFSRNNDVAITDEQRSSFYKNRVPPESFKIWVGRYPSERGKGFYWHFTQSVHFDADVLASKDPDNPPINTQTTTYMVGQFYVHVFTCPIIEVFNHVKCLGRRGDIVLDQIWPITKPTIWWPRIEMTDRDADGITVSIHNELLRLIHSTPKT